MPFQNGQNPHDRSTPELLYVLHRYWKNNLPEESKIKILNDKLTYSEIVDLYMDKLEDIEVPEFYKELIDSYYIETDITKFTTRSGENLMIMCRYGYNY